MTTNMKILVISHTYIVDLNGEKLRSLAKLNPDSEVVVAVPKRWRPGGVQNRIIETQPKDEGNFRIVPLANFSQNNQALLVFGVDLIQLLLTFKPNIIQVEQGAKALCYAQTIFLNKLLKIKAKNLFFTWWNLPYDTKFPISWLEKFNLENTDGAIPGNQDAADILREHGYEGTLKVMPQLGVDETLFFPNSQAELAAQVGINANEFVIGYLGRFVPEKGLLTLLNAVSGLSSQSWKLLLVGRGGLKNQILTQAEEQGIGDRLIILDSVAHDQVPNYLNLMNVLVLPSETTYQVKTLTAVGWKEQFGHVLIEAMACKVPVIGSDSGEIPHVIAEAGLTFPEGDAEMLQQCLQKVIENPETAKKLAEAGYERVQKKYTNQALAQALMAFYQDLLN